MIKKKEHDLAMASVEAIGEAMTTISEHMNKISEHVNAAIQPIKSFIEKADEIALREGRLGYVIATHARMRITKKRIARAWRIDRKMLRQIKDRGVQVLRVYARSPFPPAIVKAAGQIDPIFGAAKTIRLDGK